ncbi:hypothetical protein GCM10027422_34840 [Hymenobacter arcticus]
MVLTLDDQPQGRVWAILTGNEWGANGDIDFVAHAVALKLGAVA